MYDCAFGWKHTPDYSRRATAEGISIINCDMRNATIGPALFRNIVVENLKSDSMILFSPVYEHVTLRGRFGRWMIHGAVQPGPPYWMPPAYWESCLRFYKNVDWALDISQAEFADFSFRTGGVPTHLVKRDPETQVVVRREQVIEGRWRRLGLAGYTEVGLKLLLEDQATETVLVVPKRMKDAKRLVEDLRTLQAAGIAQPD
jgi:hypothetical protein